MEGHHDPCMDNLFPQLWYVLYGIRHSTGNQPVHIRLLILSKLKHRFGLVAMGTQTLYSCEQHAARLFSAFLCCGELRKAIYGVRVDGSPQTHKHQFVFE